MSAKFLLTLALPEPAPTLLAAAGDVRVLGHIPAEEELAGALAGEIDVLCCQLRDSVSERVLDRAGPRLRAVCNYAVGYDNIDRAAAARHHIWVTNTPDVLTAATADCAVGLMLAAARRLAEGDRLVRSGGFTGWAPQLMLGLELAGATLAIVGMGRIGQAVAVRARAFGMQVIYVSRSPGSPPPAAVPDARAVDLATALREADVLSLHAPLTPATHHLIDAAALAAMKPTAILVNTARGPLVDEAALVDALRRGQIAGAGLDVYEHEPVLSPGLADCPTAVLSPHLGSATVRTRSEMARVVAENAMAAARGETPPNALAPPA